MRKGSGFKGGSKAVAKSGRVSSSRGLFASRSGSSWGGNGGRSWSGRRPFGGGSRSWLSIGGSRRDLGTEDESPFADSALGAWWDRAGSGSPVEGVPGDGIGRTFGEGLAGGLGDALGDQLGRDDNSAAFWRGVAVCALLVAAVVLVLHLSG